MTIAPESVNLPHVVAELRRLYPLYEQALVSNDVPTLVEMFWPSPHVMRFGITENLYGQDQLEAFRASRPTSDLARTITRLDIVAFGPDTGSITLEFERQAPNGILRGRQSQLWIRFLQGWRIASAHVSLLP